MTDPAPAPDAAVVIACDALRGARQLSDLTVNQARAVVDALAAAGWLRGQARVGDLSSRHPTSS